LPIAIEGRYFRILQTACERACARNEAKILEFRRRNLFWKVREGIAEARKLRARNGEMVATLDGKFACRAALHEWKDARMIRRRERKQRAFDFSKRRILVKAWKALPIGLKRIREDKQKKEFTKRMLDKAREYLNMEQTGTLPEEPKETELQEELSSSMGESFF
jgi:hypothetical protein